MSLGKVWFKTNYSLLKRYQIFILAIKKNNIIIVIFKFNRAYWDSKIAVLKEIQN